MVLKTLREMNVRLSDDKQNILVENLQTDVCALNEMPNLVENLNLMVHTQKINLDRAEKTLLELADVKKEIEELDAQTKKNPSKGK